MSTLRGTRVRKTHRRLATEVPDVRPDHTPVRVIADDADALRKAVAWKVLAMQRLKDKLARRA